MSDRVNPQATAMRLAAKTAERQAYEERLRTTTSAAGPMARKLMRLETEEQALRDVLRHERGNQEIAGATEPNDNGWRRTSVWQYDMESTGMMGDDALGLGFTASYEKVGTPWRGEITYYVEPSILDPHSTDSRQGTFGVMVCMSDWREQDGDQAELDTEYDHGDALCHETVEEAERVARRLALRNESDVFLR
jgi:hypothetical protein